MQRFDPRRDGPKVEVLNDVTIDVIEARGLACADSVRECRPHSITPMMLTQQADMLSPAPLPPLPRPPSHPQ
eukprot:COSAG01_NODE_190_length_22595_cov_16.442301_1_plen_72_part_00